MGALKPPTQLNGTQKPDGFEAWYATNVKPQAQPGYAVVQVSLPIGDITADQTRALADIARRYVRDTIRATVEQTEKKKKAKKKEQKKTKKTYKKEKRKERKKRKKNKQK